MSGYYWRRLAGEYDSQKSALDAIREAADAEGVEKLAAAVTREQQKKRKRNPSQRRGPNA